MSAIRSIQAPAAVVMIRPHRFTPNPETAVDNAFQSAAEQGQAEALACAGHREVTAAAECLEAQGVRVHLFEDEGERDTPDSVFPNNWFSTHPGGHVAIYSMYSPSRRRERRSDVIEMLKAEYRVQDVIDYSGLEQDNLFLEGTGAMVFDHLARVAYAARSNRANPVALERFSTHFNFEPMVFDTADAAGQPIYHTNVLMCVATEFALIGLDTITDARRAAEVRARLEESGREVIDLSHAQIGEFAGNAIELTGRDGRLLALSQRACDSLTPAQKSRIERSARLSPLAVPTIEMAGGSVRCMIAGIHLSPRR
ncbi:citrulline utilization hydrolase CtlX [Variovorax sp. J31P207]|uniref:citrulline utilization hydrolase CtlX n=1 Tax=Variovorax sp. J31P207 TaxID=3053510 RepID=UPI002577CAA6|nr:arginine deiminase-related protein [Variovorax sp. J31P207]MDM0067028.1 arginine deiminase-related protein [Variovorax sp. J31P207]